MNTEHCPDAIENDIKMNDRTQSQSSHGCKLLLETDKRLNTLFELANLSVNASLCPQNVCLHVKCYSVLLKWLYSTGLRSTNLRNRKQFALLILWI